MASVPAALLCCCLAWGQPAPAEETPDLTALAQEVKTLRELLAGVPALEARLAEVEAQLAALKSGQPAAAPVVAAAPKGPSFDGYGQLRFGTDADGGESAESFVRRLRLNARGALDEATSYRFELQMDSALQGKGPGSRVQLRTAYVDRELGAGRLRFGQAKIPFGYELELSAADLWSGERSLLMDRLFPNQRDIGLQFQWPTGEGNPVVDVGVFNGAGINTRDDNARKDWMARVRWPWAHGSASASYYNGAVGAGDDVMARSRLGVGADWTSGQWSALAEWIAGQDAGHHVSGWYGQLGYSPTETAGTAFAKYDEYDENRAEKGDGFGRLTLGYWYDVSPRTRLTLAGEFRSIGEGFSERDNWSDTAAWLQCRFRY